MKAQRILVGLIGTALLGIVPASVVAGEAAAQTVTAHTVTAGHTSGRAVKHRKVTSHVIRVRGNNLVFKGKVSPRFKHKFVYIQKRNCVRGCHWRVWNKVVTDRFGHYRSPVSAPRHGSDYWRAKVNKQGGFAASYSAIWRTFRQ